MEREFEVLLYYKYTKISNPEVLVEEQKALCRKLELKGRIIIAQEGINGTLEGKSVNTQKYIDLLVQDERFKDIDFKRSTGTGNAFPKLKVKLRNEIVSLHLGNEDINPTEITGKYLSPEELHDWFEKRKEFYIIDMRNDYEQQVGYFENSILPGLKNFRDLPKVLPALSELKDKAVLTVCTGGVRCEKASGFLIKNGFTSVYQLYGGIVSYMEKYPNQNFLGKLYVFDNRIVMGFNTDAPEHRIISKCSKCGESSDNYIDCAYLHCKGHRHFLCCKNCMEFEENLYCSKNCFIKDNPETVLFKNNNHANMFS